MRDLAASPETGASSEAGGAVLAIREGDGFSGAMRASEGGVEATPAGFSAGPFLVDLIPGG